MSEQQTSREFQDCERCGEEDESVNPRRRFHDGVYSIVNWCDSCAWLFRDEIGLVREEDA